MPGQRGYSPVVGTGSATNQVYIWSGGVTSSDEVAWDADYVLTGGVANGEAGTALAVVGQLSDGEFYLAVGAPDGGIGVVYFNNRPGRTARSSLTRAPPAE